MGAEGLTVFVREELNPCRAISGKAREWNVLWCQSKGKRLKGYRS